MPDSSAPRRVIRTWLLDFSLLFVLAAALIWPLFRAEYLDAWNSIEATFISDARFLNANWPHPGWQPNWYCGTRFDYVYPPALRYGTAALSRWLGVPTARSYHLYIALLYSLGIAGVYLLVRAGTGSRLWGTWAAAASALISPAFLFFKDFRADYGTIYWMPLRLGVLVRYGEGPHMSAFALLPIALAAAWYGVRRDRPVHLAAAGFVSALVVANNFYGATALAILFPVLVWSVWLAEQDWLVWARAAAIAALAWGFDAFWLTPSYLEVTLRNMRLVSAPGHGWSVALGAAVAIVYAAISFRLARGKPERTWPAFALGAFVLMGLNVLGQYYVDFRVMGEPGRLIPELDFVFFLAATVVFAAISRRGRRWSWIAIALAVAALIPAKGYVRRAWRLLPPPSDHNGRIEYQITDWLHQNLPGVRAMATGSVRFWYNAWYDLPQVGGGSEQGTLNLLTSFAYVHIAADEKPDLPILWMKALGGGAMIVHDARSKEIYHDWVKPEKFDGVLPKIYDNGAGDRIYTVPRRHPHIARIVDLSRLRSIHTSDPEPTWEQLTEYVDVIENSSEKPVEFQWLDTRSARVKANFIPGQALLFQETHDPAWKAYAGGRQLETEKDPFNFLVVRVPPGDRDILLQFETPLENRLGAVATLLSAIVIAGLLRRGWKRTGPAAGVRQ